MMLRRYRDYAPTAYDTKGLNGDDHGLSDWYVVSQVNRDSDALERSNFRVLEKDAGRSGVDVETHRFGHWACGWFDLLLCRDDDAGTKWATSWAEALADYPVADDVDFSEVEADDRAESWCSWARADVIRAAGKALAKVGLDIDAMGVDVDGLADDAESQEAYHGNGYDDPSGYSSRDVQRIAARLARHLHRWASRPCDPRAVKRHMRGVALWEI